MDMHFSSIRFVGSICHRAKCAAVKQPESACGPFDVKFNVKTSANLNPPAAEAGSAQVYVAEDRTPLGVPTSGVNPTIRLGMDSQWMGADHGNSYLYFGVKPGEHHLCANWQPGFGGHAIQPPNFMRSTRSRIEHTSFVCVCPVCRTDSEFF